MQTQITTNRLNYSIFTTQNSKWIFIYNKNYSAILKIKKNINVTHSYCGIYIQQNTTILQVFLKQLSSFFFTKIKFSGKGYKIKKNNHHNLILLFNRAHITSLWWKNIILKKLKKYKIYVKHTIKNKNIVKLLLNIRSVNIFTKKGLRLSRQIIFKKKGKK